MIVEQIWTANSGRNFNYLIACAETGEALAVDPLDHEKCLAAAKAKTGLLRNTRPATARSRKSISPPESLEANSKCNVSTRRGSRAIPAESRLPWDDGASPRSGPNGSTWRRACHSSPELRATAEV